MRSAENVEGFDTAGGPEARESYEVIAELYRVHHGELFHVANRILQSQELAEDAVQQAFANTLSAVDNGVKINHPKRWLRRCVRNACLDELKVSKDVPLSQFEEIDTTARAITGPIVELVSLKERCAIVHGALGDLPDSQRSAFLLSELRGLTIREIAAVLHRTEFAVSRLLFRARSRVREDLKRGSALLAGPLAFVHGTGSGTCSIIRSGLRAPVARGAGAFQAWLGSLAERTLHLVHKPALALTAGALVTAAPVILSPGLGPKSVTGTHRANSPSQLSADLAGYLSQWQGRSRSNAGPSPGGVPQLREEPSSTRSPKDSTPSHDRKTGTSPGRGKRARPATPADASPKSGGSVESGEATGKAAAKQGPADIANPSYATFEPGEGDDPEAQPGTSVLAGPEPCPGECPYGRDGTAELTTGGQATEGKPQPIAGEPAGAVPVADELEPSEPATYGLMADTAGAEGRTPDLRVGALH